MWHLVDSNDRATGSPVPLLNLSQRDKYNRTENGITAGDARSMGLSAGHSSSEQSSAARGGEQQILTVLPSLPCGELGGDAGKYGMYSRSSAPYLAHSVQPLLTPSPSLLRDSKSTAMETAPRSLFRLSPTAVFPGVSSALNESSRERLSSKKKGVPVIPSSDHHHTVHGKTAPFPESPRGPPSGTSSKRPVASNSRGGKVSPRLKRKHGVLRSTFDGITKVLYDDGTVQVFDSTQADPRIAGLLTSSESHGVNGHQTYLPSLRMTEMPPTDNRDRVPGLFSIGISGALSGMHCEASDRGQEMEVTPTVVEERCDAVSADSRFGLGTKPTPATSDAQWMPDVWYISRTHSLEGEDPPHRKEPSRTPAEENRYCGDGGARRTNDSSVLVTNACLSSMSRNAWDGKQGPNDFPLPQMCGIGEEALLSSVTSLGNLMSSTNSAGGYLYSIARRRDTIAFTGGSLASPAASQKVGLFITHVDISEHEKDCCVSEEEPTERDLTHCHGMSVIADQRIARRAAKRRTLRENAESLFSIRLPVLDSNGVPSHPVGFPCDLKAYDVYLRLIQLEKGAIHTQITGLDFMRFMERAPQAVEMMVVYFWYIVAHCRKTVCERMLIARYEEVAAATRELLPRGMAEGPLPLFYLEHLIEELQCFILEKERLCPAPVVRRKASQNTYGRRVSCVSPEMMADILHRAGYTVLPQVPALFRDSTRLDDAAVSAVSDALDSFFVLQEELAELVDYEELCFHRLSILFGDIFLHLRSNKGNVLQSYSMVVVRVVFYALWYCFPNDVHAGVFNADFRADIHRLWHYWSSGLTMTHVLVKDWPVPSSDDVAERERRQHATERASVESIRKTVPTPMPSRRVSCSHPVRVSGSDCVAASVTRSTGLAEGKTVKAVANEAHERGPECHLVTNQQYVLPQDNGNAKLASGVDTNTGSIADASYSCCSSLPTQHTPHQHIAPTPGCKKSVICLRTASGCRDGDGLEDAAAGDVSFMMAGGSRPGTSQKSTASPRPLSNLACVTAQASQRMGFHAQGNISCRDVKKKPVEEFDLDNVDIAVVNREFRLMAEFQKYTKHAELLCSELEKQAQQHYRGQKRMQRLLSKRPPLSSSTTEGNVVEDENGKPERPPACLAGTQYPTVWGSVGDDNTEAGSHVSVDGMCFSRPCTNACRQDGSRSAFKAHSSANRKKNDSLSGARAPDNTVRQLNRRDTSVFGMRSARANEALCNTKPLSYQTAPDASPRDTAEKASSGLPICYAFDDSRQCVRAFGSCSTSLSLPLHVTFDKGKGCDRSKCGAATYDDASRAGSYSRSGRRSEHVYSLRSRLQSLATADPFTAGQVANTRLQLERAKYATAEAVEQLPSLIQITVGNEESNGMCLKAAVAQQFSLARASMSRFLLPGETMLTAQPLALCEADVQSALLDSEVVRFSEVPIPFTSKVASALRTSFAASAQRQHERNQCRRPLPSNLPASSSFDASSSTSTMALCYTSDKDIKRQVQINSPRDHGRQATTLQLDGTPCRDVYACDAPSPKRSWKLSLAPFLAAETTGGGMYRFGQRALLPTASPFMQHYGQSVLHIDLMKGSTSPEEVDWLSNRAGDDGQRSVEVSVNAAAISDKRNGAVSSGSLQECDAINTMSEKSLQSGMRGISLCTELRAPVRRQRFRGEGNASALQRNTRVMVIAAEHCVKRPLAYQRLGKEALRRQEHLAEDMQRIAQRDRLSREKYAVGHLNITAAMHQTQSDSATRHFMEHARREFNLGDRMPPPESQSGVGAEVICDDEAG